jgi:hypothetical protein
VSDLVNSDACPRPTTGCGRRRRTRSPARSCRARSLVQTFHCARPSRGGARSIRATPSCNHFSEFKMFILISTLRDQTHMPKGHLGPTPPPFHALPPPHPRTRGVWVVPQWVCGTPLHPHCLIPGLGALEDRRLVMLWVMHDVLRTPQFIIPRALIQVHGCLSACSGFPSRPAQSKRGSLSHVQQLFHRGAGPLATPLRGVLHDDSHTRDSHTRAARNSREGRL